MFSLQTDAALIPKIGLSSKAMDFLFSVLKLMLAKYTVILYLCSARGRILATHFIVGNFGICDKEGDSLLAPWLAERVFAVSLPPPWLPHKNKQS